MKNCDLPRAGSSRRVLVTGGAGFIGSNLVASLLRRGVRVTVLDSLARPGSATRLAWLRRLPDAARLQCVRGDVRNAGLVAQLAESADEIYHLAAQVAVTSSLDDPRLDFEINLAGTFNVLEAARRCRRPPFLLFTSTNKVYGSLESALPGDSRPLPSHPPEGCDESCLLDFHSPYACSKGAADQYVRDYSRVFQLPAVVFRMSCIYGPHQFGSEDQGWVSHFALAALGERKLTIYGDGTQVRDLLEVGDLVEAIQCARQHPALVAGKIFNIGGGPAFARSLLDVVEILRNHTGFPLPVTYGPWRTGDQRWYVSDTRRFHHATGWHPAVAPETGIPQLCQWLAAHRRTGTPGSAGHAALAG